MDILKGAPTVQAMFDKMQLKLMHLEGYQPHLAIIRVGEKPDDIAYERGAKSRMEKTGLRCSCYEFPENITMEEFEQSFDFINNDDDVDGILLLRPLPPERIRVRTRPVRWCRSSRGPLREAV